MTRFITLTTYNSKVLVVNVAAISCVYEGIMGNIKSEEPVMGSVVHLIGDEEGYSVLNTVQEIINELKAQPLG